MLAALGVVVPDVLQRQHLASFAESTWWKVAGARLDGKVLNYLGVEGLRIAGAQVWTRKRVPSSVFSKVL